MTAPLRVALIGAGSMGSLHARVISQSERTELVTVIDPVEETGRSVTARFGGMWQAEPGDLSAFDAVVIAAPTHLHYNLAKEVLAAGKPLLLEKPITSTLEETAELVETAAVADIPLMCGFVERYNPAILTVAGMLEGPLHVQAVRHGPYAPRIRTGVAWDLLIHDVDACLRLVGAEAETVSGGTTRVHPLSLTDAEDTADAVMSFAGGAVATASASRLGHRKVRTLFVTELDRVIEIDLLRRDVTIYRHVSNDAPMQDGLGYRQQTIIEIPELITSREPLAAQLDRFCDLVTGTADIKEERESILPPHRAVARLLGA